VRWVLLPRRSRSVGACVLAVAGVTSAVLVTGASAAKTAVAKAPVRPAQVLQVESIGVSAAAGLAFSAESGILYLIAGPERSSAPAATSIVTLKSGTSTPDQATSTRLAAAIEDPINVAFDARRARLLLLAHARQLLEVPVGPAGELEASRLSRHDAVHLGLEDPRGLTVDPASGVVFILDGARIVRVEPAADGSFEQAMTSEMDLSASSLGELYGLAYDPATGHLHVRAGERLYELTAAGEMVAVRDLARLELVDPQSFAFAPSRDQTDDPAATSLFVSDRVAAAARPSGTLVELSLAAPAATAAIDFTSQLVRTVNLGGLSPPSPDPSGITYVASSNRLVVSDGEVEETVNGITHFQGANVWELSLSGVIQRTANISNRPPTSTPMTNEPAGIAYNPSNRHYYVSADTTRRVFDLNTGADRLIGTADDTWTFFNTHASNTDPEGIAYSTANGNLFVADGVNREIFQYTTTGALVGNFDVQRYGINDPNSVEYNPDSNTLFVLSDRLSGTGNQRLVIETTITGSLIRTIDVGASNSFRQDGIAYAPASDGSGAKRFYIVDRVLDNNLDPNAVDGKLYEMTAPSPPPSGPLNWAANNSADFDGDRITDFGLYRGLSPNSLWYAPGTAGGGPFQIYFGASSDIPVPGDYDGDGKTDAVIYRPSNGLWYGPRTGAAQIVIQTVLGSPGDIPIPGDYNGDGRTDPAIFRPSIGLFFATNAAGNQVLLNTRFGTSGDVPVPRDYDGDGKTDPAIYRQNATPQGFGLWYALLSGGGVHQIYFGAPGDVPVPGDYNGDKIADSVIFRPSTGLWYGPQTGAAAIVIQMNLGQSGDVPIPGYYDNNLAVDPAIFRRSTGLWFSVLSGGGTRTITGLGQPGDVPVQKRPALAGGV
jgi:hypothetical protein